MEFIKVIPSDDETVPDRVAVEMTVDEVIVLRALAGAICTPDVKNYLEGGHAIKHLTKGREVELQDLFSDDIYSCTDNILWVLNLRRSRVSPF